MGNYGADRAWSEKFIPEIKNIVGPRLLEPAPFEMDAEQATDLIVLKAKDMRIAARVRRPGYADSFPYDFTIRARRDTGADTELKKIVNGWGDWMFYGHATDEGTIGRWFLVDLDAFRAALIRRHQMRCGDRSNGDGTYFKWFDVRSFPKEPPILVACSGER